MTDSPADERITLRLPSELLKRYQDEAADLQVPVSELIRAAMVLGLPQTGPHEFVLATTPDGRRTARRRSAFDINPAMLKK